MFQVEVCLKVLSKLNYINMISLYILILFRHFNFFRKSSSPLCRASTIMNRNLTSRAHFGIDILDKSVSRERVD